MFGLSLNKPCSALASLLLPLALGLGEAGSFGGAEVNAAAAAAVREEDACDLPPGRSESMISRVMPRVRETSVGDSCLPLPLFAGDFGEEDGP